MREFKKELCVVHLVRAHNGTGPLKDFLESYKLNPGGITHDLIILFKGFNSDGPSQEYRLLLKSFNYRELHVSDDGFDITAYFAVHHAFDYKYYCFLNSFSIILDSEWLLKLYQYISQEQVGLVGATGSYQSLYLSAAHWKFLVENSIKKSKYPKLRRLWLGRLDWNLHYLINKCRFGPYFPSFPNFHIRTNAFIVKQEVIKEIMIRKIQSKIVAYKCESGKQSITNQILKSGKDVLVIGKNGQAYKKEDWWKSNTFWRENQENLLVSDNQTRSYSEATLAEKILFSYNAWGQYASPEFKNNS